MKLEAEGVIKKTPYFIQLPITQLDKFSTGKKKHHKQTEPNKAKKKLKKSPTRILSNTYWSSQKHVKMFCPKTHHRVQSKLQQQ
jgi:hypothetical protein